MYIDRGKSNLNSNNISKLLSQPGPARWVVIFGPCLQAELAEQKCNHSDNKTSNKQVTFIHYYQLGQRRLLM